MGSIANCRRRFGAKNLGLMTLAMGLVGVFGAASLVAAEEPAPTTCTADFQGADDEAGQKDLTYLCRDLGDNDPYEEHVSFNFDDTTVSGANTLDAQIYYDTDGDGNSNYAIEVTLINSAGGNGPVDELSYEVLTCENTAPLSCVGGVPVDDPATICEVSYSSEGPFDDGDPETVGTDTTVLCWVDFLDFTGTPEFQDVCTLPSESNPSVRSDCLVTAEDCDDPDFNAACAATANQCEVGACVINTVSVAVCDISNKGEGVACGDDTDDACTNPDTCDGEGMCVPNHEPTTSGCGTDGTGVCAVNLYCDGAGECGDPDFSDTDSMICGDDGSDVCVPADVCLNGACVDGGFATSGTMCGSDTNDECTNPDTCDGAGACQPNNAPDDTSCGDSGDECNDGQVCTAGACGGGGPKPAGTACGSDTNNECTNPDTCDASGVCQPNDAPDDTSCGDSGDECNDGQFCTAGACGGGGPKPAGTTCGSDTNDECTNPDTCDASGVCQPNNAPDDTSCGDSGDECNDGQFCTAGACGGGGPKPAGTTCGSDTNDECTNPDTCDASGVCQPNDAPDDTSCGDSGDECNDGQVCTAGACGGGGPKPAGTACGSDTNDECTNPDTCDASGVCQPNDAPDDTSCGDSGDECNDGQVCTAGACGGGGPKPAGTACGSDTNDECTNPDTCDASGVCQPNDAPDDTSCGDSGDECNDGQVCTAGACGGGGPKPAGTACGSGTNNECTNPDTCDATGECQPNNEPVDTPCNEDDDLCTLDVCDADGACVNDSSKDCDDDNLCTNDSCEKDTGECVNANVPDDPPISCDDDDACTGDRAGGGDFCVNGVCEGPPVDCSDGNECTTDTCDSVTGCSNVEEPDGDMCLVEVCRTPGYWGTHPDNLALVIGAALDPGLGLATQFQVCGVSINPPSATPPVDTCAIEGICIDSGKDKRNKLARDLITMAANCVVSGYGDGDDTLDDIDGDGLPDAQNDLVCDGSSVEALFEMCNLACDDTDDLRDEQVWCSAQVDCYNNGGTFVYTGEMEGYCYTGTCSAVPDQECGADAPSCDVDECELQDDGVTMTCSASGADCSTEACPWAENECVATPLNCHSWELEQSYLALGNTSADPSMCEEARRPPKKKGSKGAAQADDLFSCVSP